MTRLRNLALGGLAALAITGAATAAFAEEPGTFQNRLNGATIGLPLGAAAPPGLYTGLESAYLSFPGEGHGDQADVCGAGPGSGTLAVNGPCHVFAIAQAVPLLWSTGWTFLGASYSMAAVVAFYDANVTMSNTFGSNLLGGPGNPFIGALHGDNNVANVLVFANPTLTPIALSWNLGQGWFVSAGFNFMVPIGTNASNFTNPDYWTLEPTLAISYIHNNWVITANMFYDINTDSKGTCCFPGITGNPAAVGYKNGDAFYLDWSAAYKFGKWQIGPVGYIEYQTTSDVPGSGVAALCATTQTTGGGVVNATANCGKYQDVAFGGIIGYDFGPVDMQVWVTDSVYFRDAIDGLSVWSRIGFRLWAPEAAKPLVAKN